MASLDSIASKAHKDFEALTAAREKALAQTRRVIQHSARAIRAIHREEAETAAEELAAASKLVKQLNQDLKPFPQLYSAGYTQDAMKEYAEANLVRAMVTNGKVPTAQDLGIETAAYLKGLSETVGELRRRCLDIMRHGHSDETERLLHHMDEIYSLLVTMDYADAVTGGLRRLTDVCRSLVERTRGDVTLSLRQQRLEQNLMKAEKRFADSADKKS
jgi:translin